MPKVSVIMPVYNAESYLAEAVQSILDQTFIDFEFLIYNDGSTDRSLEILNSFSDSRIKVTSVTPNQGYVYHLNTGLREAQGKYIARMDADDISHKQRLEKQVVFMDQNVDVILCGTRFEKINSKIYVDLPLDDTTIRLSLLHNNVFGHPTVMFRRDVLRKHNLCYPLVPVIEDYGLWSKLAPYGKLANLPEYLLRYRDGVGVSSKPLPEHIRQENQRMFLSYAKEFLRDTKLSDEEIGQLSLLLNQRSVKDVASLRLFSRLIKHIKQRFVHPYLTRQEMGEFLQKHFFYLCTTSTYLGPVVFGVYMRSGLGYASTWLTIKLALKSMFFFRQSKMVVHDA